MPKSAGAAGGGEGGISEYFRKTPPGTSRTPPVDTTLKVRHERHRKGIIDTTPTEALEEPSLGAFSFSREVRLFHEQKIPKGFFT